MLAEWQYPTIRIECGSDRPGLYYCSLMPAMSLEEALQLAQDRIATGAFSEAESILRQILSQNPQCADALHGLGLIAHRMGQHASAAELIERAIELAGENPLFLRNLGAAYLSLDKAEDAIKTLQR